MKRWLMAATLAAGLLVWTGAGGPSPAGAQAVSRETAGAGTSAGCPNTDLLSTSPGRDPVVLGCIAQLPVSSAIPVDDGTSGAADPGTSGAGLGFLGGLLSGLAFILQGIRLFG